MALIAHATGALVPRVLDAEAEKIDLYYPDKSNLKTEKHSLLQRTNAIFNLSAIQSSGGSSSVYVSPTGSAISTIMVAIQLPEASAFPSGLGLPQSWGYNALNFVQMRIGNSSLFQWSGRQLMLQAIKSAGSPQQANDLMALAGNSMADVNDAITADDGARWAYLTIPMPWCGAEAQNSPLGLPTNELSSPVQFIINLKPLSSIVGVTQAPAVVPSGLSYSSAFLQVKQLIPTSVAMLERKAHLALPIVFAQQENSVSGVVGGAARTINLLGFRNGSVKNIEIYCVDESADSALEPFGYVLPSDVNIVYMGNELHRFNGYSAQYWSTVYGRVPSRWLNPKFNTVTKVFDARLTNWVTVPLTGLYTDLDAQMPISSAGIAIQNGIVNCTLTLPDPAKTYTVYYYADLQSAIVFHDGTADYAF